MLGIVFFQRLVIVKRCDIAAVLTGFSVPFQRLYRLFIGLPFGLIFAVLIRFLYKGIIIKPNKTEPTYTKTSLLLCEKRRFFMARTEKGVVLTN